MDECVCKKLEGSGIDLETPRNEPLSAFYRRSFAHHTIKDRVPVNITQTIDGLVRSKEEIGAEYGLEGIEDLKVVIGELSKLKYEVQTNKPLEGIVSTDDDAKSYNDFLKAQLDTNCHYRWFSGKFVFNECYLYRRMRQAFEKTSVLQEYDPFRNQKQAAFFNAQVLIEALGNNLLNMLKGDTADRDLQADCNVLLKLNLWGNKCDLSQSNMKDGVPQNLNLIGSLDELDSNILCNDSELVYNAVIAENRFQVIDLICDNSGYELFTDLCLADFFVSRGFCEKVRFYVKTMPWFISDVLKFDFNWMIDQLCASENETLKTLGTRWLQYVDSQVFTIEEHKFWTTAICFKNMFTADESLYRKIARAKLAIFKGDLNYRKLFDDRNWDPVTPMETCLEGFHPTKICSLRTLKCDIICGLPEGVEQEVSAKDKEWMINGEYGVIQCCEKITRLI